MFFTHKQGSAPRKRDTFGTETPVGFTAGRDEKTNPSLSSVPISIDRREESYRDGVTEAPRIEV